MQDTVARPHRAKAPLLRGIVLLAGVAEIFSAAYVWYALNLDDTTSWIGMIVPEANDFAQALILPLAIGGAFALALGVTNRWLWLALGLIAAAPAVSWIWLFA